MHFRNRSRPSLSVSKVRPRSHKSSSGASFLWFSEPFFRAPPWGAFEPKYMVNAARSWSSADFVGPDWLSCCHPGVKTLLDSRRQPEYVVCGHSPLLGRRWGPVSAFEGGDDELERIARKLFAGYEHGSTPGIGKADSPHEAASRPGGLTDWCGWPGSKSGYSCGINGRRLRSRSVEVSPVRLETVRCQDGET